MVELLAAAFALLTLLASPAETGWTSRYDPGVMEYQVAYHGLDLPCAGCAVAALSCDDIGEIWLVQPVSGKRAKHRDKASQETWIPVIVSDCTGDAPTYTWMRDNNIILELSFELAEQFEAVDGSVQLAVLRP